MWDLSWRRPVGASAEVAVRSLLPSPAGGKLMVEQRSIRVHRCAALPLEPQAFRCWTILQSVLFGWEGVQMGMFSPPFEEAFLDGCHGEKGGEMRRCG
jgi:hypothetical protein